MMSSHLRKLRQLWSSRRKHLWQLKPGEGQDFRIIDENTRTVWASEWCRKARQTTRPRGMHGRRV